jgi:hypothetical protein
MREIKKKYKFSELAVVAWRSREQAAAMHKRTHRDDGPVVVDSDNNTMPQQRQVVNEIEITADSYILPKHLNNGVPVAKKFFDDEGNLTLQRATGNEAARYLNAIGLNIPVLC